MAKLIIVAMIVTVCNAAQLDKAYLPPFGARQAGGSEGSIQTPNYQPNVAANTNNYNAPIPGTNYGSPIPATNYGAPFENSARTTHNTAEQGALINSYLPPFNREGSNFAHSQQQNQQYNANPTYYQPQQYNGQQFEHQNKFQGTVGANQPHAGQPTYGAPNAQPSQPSQFGAPRQPPSYSPESGYKY